MKLIALTISYLTFGIQRRNERSSMVLTLTTTSVDHLTHSVKGDGVICNNVLERPVGSNSSLGMHTLPCICIIPEPNRYCYARL